MAGARRFIWNWGLAAVEGPLPGHGKSISLEQLSAELTALKQQPETAWLNEVDSQALQQALKDLHQAFANFFKKRARHPRFKTRKRDRARFRIPQRVTVEDGRSMSPRSAGSASARAGPSTARPRAPRSAARPTATGTSVSRWNSRCRTSRSRRPIPPRSSGSTWG